MFKTVQVNTLELTFNLHSFLVHNQIIYEQDCLITFNFRNFFNYLITFNIPNFYLVIKGITSYFMPCAVLFIACSTAR